MLEIGDKKYVWLPYCNKPTEVEICAVIWYGDRVQYIANGDGFIFRKVCSGLFETAAACRNANPRSGWRWTWYRDGKRQKKQTKQLKKVKQNA